MKEDNKKLLITGANGFVGRYLLKELLSSANSSSDMHVATIKQEYNRYSQIVAIDRCPGEVLTKVIDYSVRVIPVELNLVELLDESSLTYKAMQTLLLEVDCIIHTAGIVDTREDSSTKSRLLQVNVDVTDKLIRMANAANVPRFIHLSSASACLEKHTRTSSPWLFPLLLSNSLFSSNVMKSTYAYTKFLSESKALQFYQPSYDQEKKTSVAVLRPHVVWGSGDPLATDIMLDWQKKFGGLPQPMIGDVDTMVVSVHVRTLVRYILLADIALRLRNGELTIAGKVLNVGERLHTLSDLHQTILETKGDGRYHQQSVVPFVNTNTTVGRLVALPSPISAVIVSAVQTLDWLTGYRLPYTFLRLVTANNLAYTTRDFLNFDGYIKSFEQHCRSIFQAASSVIAASGKLPPPSASFQDWLNGEINFYPHGLCWSTHSSAKQVIDGLDDRTLYQLVREHPLSNKWQLGPIEVKNRVIKAATYECMCSMEDGVPTKQLIDFHEAVAAGGAGMTIVAYGSVSFDGRSFPTQLCLNKDESNSKLMDIHRRTKDMLSQLTAAVHRHGCKACIQITHAGAFNDANTNLRSKKEYPRGPSSILNPLTLRFCQSLDQDEATLQRIEDDFAFSTSVCQDVGFDAIELHLGHGYLLSQFLSRRTNPKYANDPHARLAFPLRVLKRVVAVAHGIDNSFGDNKKKIAVLVKFNVSELTEDDLPLSDCRMFARAFYDAGADLLVPSGGHVMVNGLHMLRGRAPVRAMANAQTNRLKGLIVRLLGPWLIPEEPYREAFFLERVLSVCFGAGIPLEKICLIGGLHDVLTLLRATGSNTDALLPTETKLGIQIGGYGFGALQLGRALLADEKYCLKVGIATVANDDKDYAGEKVNCCDNSNACIIDATMAMKPLYCKNYPSLSW